MMRLALAALFLVAVVAGCGGGDVFEQGPWDIKLNNDTARAVVVRDCIASSCARFRYSKSLAPHRTLPARDYGDGTSWWLVTSSGRRLGCLTLGIQQRVEGYVLRLSTMRACPIAG